MKPRNCTSHVCSSVSVNECIRMRLHLSFCEHLCISASHRAFLYVSTNNNHNMRAGHLYQHVFAKIHIATLSASEKSLHDLRSMLHPRDEPDPLRTNAFKLLRLLNFLSLDLVLLAQPLGCSSLVTCRCIKGPAAEGEARKILRRFAAPPQGLQGVLNSGAESA